MGSEETTRVDAGMMYFGRVVVFEDIADVDARPGDAYFSVLTFTGTSPEEIIRKAEALKMELEGLIRSTKMRYADK